jgi:hypothetical protein
MATHPQNLALELGELCPLTGAHILHFYLDDIERRHAVLDFISAGVRRGDRTCWVQNRPLHSAEAAIPGLDEPEALAAGPGPRPATGPLPAGQLMQEDSHHFYLTGGVFDPDQVYRKWREFSRTTKESGFTGYQALGEVPSELEHVADGQAVVLYEANLDKELQACPPTCVICQYDARAFRGRTLVAILRVHPLVLVENRIFPNPFFQPAAWPRSH